MISKCIPPLNFHYMPSIFEIVIFQGRAAKYFVAEKKKKCFFNNVNDVCSMILYVQVEKQVITHLEIEFPIL